MNDFGAQSLDPLIAELELYWDDWTSGKVDHDRLLIFVFGSMGFGVCWVRYS